MTKVFYDTEFLENGQTISLISIGMVRVNDDGTRDEYYAVSAHMRFQAILNHKWLRENVVPYLPTLQQPGGYPALDMSHPDVKPASQIGIEVADFVLADGDDPELWAYYGSYDHVALCQLYGTMMDLPEGFPMYTNDLRQVMRALNIDRSELPEQSVNNHKAIDDARWNEQAYWYLRSHTNDWGIQDI